MCLDGNPTPWDNHIFAYKGDMMYSMISLMESLQDPFQITMGNRVYSVKAIQGQLNQQGPLQLIMPVGNVKENMDLLVTCQVMYLPAKYVGLFLDSQGYTPRDTWNCLIPALEQDQNMVNCQVLVNWLRLMITVTVAGVDEGKEPIIQVPVTTALKLIAPAVDDDLLQQQQPIFDCDLPGHNNLQQVGLEGSIIQLATAVAGNTRDNKEARLAREEGKMQDKDSITMMAGPHP